VQQFVIALSLKLISFAFHLNFQFLLDKRTNMQVVHFRLL